MLYEIWLENNGLRGCQSRKSTLLSFVALHTLRELSGAPATHIIYLPRWCHDPPDARVVAYFITLSSWSPPYARPRWCYGISHRKVSSLCLHSAALITAKTTAGASAGMLDVDAILPGGGAKPLHDLSLWCALYARAISFSATIHSSGGRLVYRRHQPPKESSLTSSSGELPVPGAATGLAGCARAKGPGRKARAGREHRAWVS